MGQRSSAETIVAIFHALLYRRTWKQQELADHVGIRPAALRNRLNELMREFPIERQEDPPHVYWSVPRDWFPGSVAFERGELADLIRELARAPRTARRDRLLQKIARVAPNNVPRLDTKTVLAPVSSEQEQACLSVVEDAASNRQTLRFRYYTASRGVLDERQASVQRVFVGPPARALAVCHRSDTLRWFRIDAMLSARVDASVPFRPAPVAKLETFLHETLDGFHGGELPVKCTFVVRAPEAAWVKRNLIEGMQAQPMASGAERIVVETAGVARLARFVVGLGAAATAETPELASMVRELALGALKQE